jgi:hypothetical protein
MMHASRTSASAEARERDVRWAEWEAERLADDRAIRRRTTNLVAAVLVALAVTMIVLWR